MQLYRHSYLPLPKEDQRPLLDRIDIHVEVPRIDYENLADKRQVEDSKTVRARVQAARERQVESPLQIGLCLRIFPGASYDGSEPLLRAGKEYIHKSREVELPLPCVWYHHIQLLLARRRGASGRSVRLW